MRAGPEAEPREKKRVEQNTRNQESIGRRAEPAPLESERHFKHMADQAPLMIWLSGSDGHRRWFNRVWLDFVGPSSSREGYSWEQAVHPEDRTAYLSAYGSAVEARKSFQVEYRLRRHDGSWRWILESSSPIHSEASDYQGHAGSCLDVTDARQSADAARESDARYRTLAESLPHLVWTCMPDGWCDYLSRQWVDYTGVPEEHQRGYGWAQQLHPEDRRRVQKAWAAATARGDQFDVEFRIRRADGLYRWFKTRAVPLRNSQGQIIKWFGSNTDFEEYKQSERRLQTQLERLGLLDRITRVIGTRQDLRSILEVVLSNLEEHLPIAFGCVCTGEPDTGVLEVAAVGAKSARIAAAAGLMERAEVGVASNKLSRCLRGGLVYEPDTRQVPVPLSGGLAAAGLRSLVLAPILVEGRVFGLLLAARVEERAFSSADCEFLRQLGEHVGLAAHQADLYQALQRAYDDLQESQEGAMQHERLRALGQMAGGIAHNINNAISPISIYTDVLLEDEPDLSATAREYLETIQRAIRDVALTVEGMREFYRKRPPEVVLGLVNLNEIVQHALDLTRARWSDIPQQRGAAIHATAELDPLQPVVWGLASELREALINLIFNAVDAMPDGGALTLRTRVVNGGGRNTAHIEVADTGVGMDDDLRRRCFEPFVTTKGERGTGLGLALVYGVVQRHNARIEIDTQPSRGSTFRITFLTATGEPAGSHGGHEAAGPMVRLRILVVDDDPRLLESLGHALRSDGHAIEIADSGAAGISMFENALARGQPFDWVITDLGMPHVDGKKVARAIKATSPATPVVMLTGWGHRLVAEDGVLPNVDHILSKPPRLSELRETLRRAHPVARQS
jgi:PAS domain S-box-containing protein